ncbi:MAG: aminoacyl-tRNA hydrolase [Oscillospiraceae bacterium]|nr:aminoacyl-tRNA hydrolase [Oscillospiraceae bacterium]MBR6429688.1 aminoacyl-tRNA hydrolase [Oscillospiraceae bacterium]
MLFQKKAAVDWLVVFLGNPGVRFAETRHNVGFMTAEVYEREHGVRIDRSKFKALTGRCLVGDAEVLLLKPQTFMNLSGDAVSQAMRFYKVPLERVLVVSDDVSLDVGKLRLRRNGSAGGHNGLKDIIAKCGGEGFPRIKIGVGQKPHPDYDMAQWVLSTFKDQDAEQIRSAVQRAAQAVDAVITQGMDKAMNEYNHG